MEHEGYNPYMYLPTDTGRPRQRKYLNESVYMNDMDIACSSVWHNRHPMGAEKGEHRSHPQEHIHKNDTDIAGLSGSDNGHTMVTETEKHLRFPQRHIYVNDTDIAGLSGSDKGHPLATETERHIRYPQRHNIYVNDTDIAGLSGSDKGHTMGTEKGSYRNYAQEHIYVNDMAISDYSRSDNGYPVGIQKDRYRQDSREHICMNDMDIADTFGMEKGHPLDTEKDRHRNDPEVPTACIYKDVKDTVRNSRSNNMHNTYLPAANEKDKDRGDSDEPDAHIDGLGNPSTDDCYSHRPVCANRDRSGTNPDQPIYMLNKRDGSGNSSPKRSRKRQRRISFLTCCSRHDSDSEPDLIIHASTSVNRTSSACGNIEDATELHDLSLTDGMSPPTAQICTTCVDQDSGTEQVALQRIAESDEYGSCRNVEGTILDIQRNMIERINGIEDFQIFIDSLDTNNVNENCAFAVGPISTYNHRGVMFTKRVSQKVVDHVAQYINNRFELFEGTVTEAGSFHDRTKVGNACEFDYQYELKHKFSFCAKQERMSKTRGCFAIHLQADCTDDCVLAPLDSFKMKETFSELVDDALHAMELPEGVEHAGFLSPYFSGVRNSGPAVTILLLVEYRGTKQLLTVDLALVFPVTINDLEIVLGSSFPTRAKRLFDEWFPDGIPQLHLVPSEMRTLWRLSTAHLEVKLMAKAFQPDGKARRTIRIMKAIVEKFLTIRHNSDHKDLVLQEDEDTKMRKQWDKFPPARLSQMQEISPAYVSIRPCVIKYWVFEHSVLIIPREDAMVHRVCFRA